MEKQHFINIGEYHVGNGSGTMVCRGLGSCVALFLYDRVTRVSGGAHIFLPEALNSNDKQVAAYLFQKVIDGMKELGADINRLRAQIIGGASVVKSNPMQIGERNIEKVKSLLLENKIFLATQDVGGDLSRSVMFDMDNGSVSIKHNVVK